MARNHYRFVTRWRVSAAREEVFAVLTDSRSLARWWPSVYREVEQLQPARGPDGVGKSLRLHTQGWLPYRLRWQLSVVDYDPPVRVAFEATGDFIGSGVWTLSERSDGTEVRYEWDVRAEKPLLRRFSFLFRPIFSLNHRWAMARGLESLALELARRRGLETPPPRGPVSAVWSGSVLGGLLAAFAVAVVALLR
jgi:uncharacterized protein YndB with AHSA1/START domain